MIPRLACAQNLVTYKLHSAYIRKVVPDFLKPKGGDEKLKAVLYALWRITYIPVAKSLVKLFG